MTMTPAEQARLDQVFQQNANLYQALKLTLEGRWTGEMPHAEAFVKACNPDEAGSWTAIPCPKDEG